MVRSVRRYDYEQVQKEVDAGTAEECLVLLKEVGEKRVLLERQRGGATLPMPEQEVEEDEHGGFRISFRPLLAAEDWNAQISLLTGMGAADLMLRGKVGILRTMPPPDPRDLARFRRQAGGRCRRGPRDCPTASSCARWTAPTRGTSRSSTRRRRSSAAPATPPSTATVPAQPPHAAVANPYAHVTAPLRRLVDRFGLVVCEALSAGEEVPGWVREALPTLPEIMATSDRRTNGVERACTDAVEAAELHPLVGEHGAGRRRRRERQGRHRPAHRPRRRGQGGRAGGPARR